jgi:hypothetical protein
LTVAKATLSFQVVKKREIIAQIDIFAMGFHTE